MKLLPNFKIKLYADGAEKKTMLDMYEKPCISGFTTNPTLMKKAGIRDYRAFALDILKEITDKPISFEVFADDYEEMERQAKEIQSWGNNVNVKIPVTNTKKEPSYELINRLSESGVQLNVTAVFTLEQIKNVSFALQNSKYSIISVFAGRIADTGLDPVPIMQSALEIMKICPNTELLWASPRELLNLFQADAAGCHIITATNEIIKKLDIIGKDLDEFSLETVKMFYNDANSVGYEL